MKTAVVVFPGSNCDRDAAVALEQAVGSAPIMVWHRDTDMPDVDLILLPGGFSHGDYLRGGAIAARAPIMTEIVRRGHEGVPIVGICNGF
ncbi:MAG: phosphoribosylformylglycinamidine synthase subunit PurQ, partial [Rhodospirillaceae bacterium]|nr:phosphoribosylformylglycinamidine synthase subunit PurQ [Rhodospirillaceae bacterium]